MQPAVILAALTLAGVMFFIYKYRATLRAHPLPVAVRAPMRFPKAHKMTRRDALFALIITAVYAVVAFAGLGDRVAPQSFYRFTKGTPSITVDMGEARAVSSIFYYTGSFHDPSASSGGYKGYDLELSTDGEHWEDYGVLTQTHAYTFHWMDHPLRETDSDGNETDDLPTARYIRLTAHYFPMELGELCILDENGDAVDPSAFPHVSPVDARRIFNEQDLKPETSNYMNSMYFDEIYHGRTAREFLLQDKVYENTHPPLGKSIISIGVTLFGMTPFGWRFMGVLFGVLMVPLTYILIKNIFGKTWLSVCGTLISAFEFMHFVQTRIATIDTYGLFFTILMYFFMYRFLAAGYDAPAHKRLIPLALCGVSFGLGIASKWTVFYAAAGLVVLYIIGAVLEGKRLHAEHRTAEFAKKFAAVIGVSVVFFVIVGFGIYYLSYIPFAAGNGKEFNFETVWANQTSMWNYHSALEATHTYQSSWWQWLLDGRPILYFRQSTYTESGAIDMISSFAAFNTPLVSWAGLAALIMLIGGLYRGARKPTRILGVLCAIYAVSGFVSQIATFIFSDQTDYTDRVTSYMFAAAVVLAVVIPFFDKQRTKTRSRDLFIIIGTLAQLLAWIPVTRCTFAYHYFPTSYFLVLALCSVFDRWDGVTLEGTERSASRIVLQPSSLSVHFADEKRKALRNRTVLSADPPRVTRARIVSAAAPSHTLSGKRAALLFTAACLFLFALFYPYLSGVFAPRWYYQTFLHWFPSWPI